MCNIFNTCMFYTWFYSITHYVALLFLVKFRQIFFSSHCASLIRVSYWPELIRTGWLAKKLQGGTCFYLPPNPNAGIASMSHHTYVNFLYECWGLSLDPSVLPSQLPLQPLFTLLKNIWGKWKSGIGCKEDSHALPIINNHRHWPCLNRFFFSWSCHKL